MRDRRDRRPQAAARSYACSSPIPAGAHTLTIAHAGYRTEHRALTIAPQQGSELRVELAPLAGAGMAAIAQIPIRCAVPDVVVALDGVAADQPAGSAVLLATSGEHNLQFSRAGYADRTLSLLLKPGVAPEIDCAMRVLPQLPETQAARLRVRSNASIVHTIIDGAAASTDQTLPAGRHRVALTAPGFEPRSQELVLAPGETRELAVRLTPLQTVQHERAASARFQRAIAYTLGATGVVAAAAAVVAAVVSKDRYADWTREHSDIQQQLDHADDALDSTALDELEARSAKNDARLKAVWQLDALTWSLAVTSGTLLASGGFLFWHAGLTEPASPTVALTGPGVELHARF